MSKRKAKTKTAAELMAELQGDREFMARREEQEYGRQKRQAALRKAEQPLIRELVEVGFNVRSVWDLVNSPQVYTEAIPILLEHLQKSYPPKIREGIARALSVPEARCAWDLLLNEFNKEIDLSPIGVKWALANALSVIADESVLDDMIHLVRDKKHGENRAVLVEALTKFDDKRVAPLLQELSADKEVGADAKKALRKLLNRRKSLTTG